MWTSFSAKPKVKCIQEFNQSSNPSIKAQILNFKFPAQLLLENIQINDIKKSRCIWTVFVSVVKNVITHFVYEFNCLFIKEDQSTSYFEWFDRINVLSIFLLKKNFRISFITEFLRNIFSMLSPVKWGNKMDVCPPHRKSRKIRCFWCSNVKEENRISILLSFFTTINQN